MNIFYLSYMKIPMKVGRKVMRFKGNFFQGK